MKSHSAFTSTRVTPLPVLSEDHMKVVVLEDVEINFSDDEWIFRIDAGVEGGKGSLTL